MIKQPHEIATTKKRFRMIIAGHPGIGKTTLALTAPNPLLIDADFGIDRVKAMHRKPSIQPKDYAEVLEDLRTNDLTPYETIVIDTGGQLLEFMKGYVIKSNPKNAKNDGSLSLQGYGAVAREFTSFINYCFYDLQKHVIVTFHAKEKEENDIIKLRLDVEGKTKDEVWKPMDLGGFMETINNKRIIGFSGCDKYYAKATHGIKGTREIPEDTTDFITKLFEEAQENIAKDAEFFEKEKKAYLAVIGELLPQIETMEAEQFNDVMERITNAKHVLTSYAEMRAAYKTRIKALGYRWDKEAKAYVPSDTVAP